MNIQEIKSKLILTNHFIERFASRFDYSSLTKEQRALSLKQKIKLLIDHSIDHYRNVDGAYSIWLNNNQEMVVIPKKGVYIALTLKDTSMNGYDHIHKKLIMLEQNKRNKFNRTNGHRKIVRETFWNNF